MSFWWVNHKQTRDHEVRGGYLWSPMRNANGAANQTYENMRRARVGDVVFSYAHGQVGAIGTVIEAACACPKPSEFGRAGDYWSDDGWLVGVDFRPVPTPLRPKVHIEAIGPLLPKRHSPLQPNGNGNQGCYLAGISDALGQLLLALMRVDEYEQHTPTRHFIREPEPSHTVLEDVQHVQADLTLPETQRIQLAKARIGQGLFRARVIMLDRSCRVTGVTDTRVLIASHIKPWKDSDNGERINGHNGLLLSPHVDALFDDQLISFEDDGTMQVHPSLSPDVLDRWHIDPKRRVEPFRPEQVAFLEHHRSLFARRVSMG